MQSLILALAASGAVALSVRSPIPLSAPLRPRQIDPSQVPPQCQTQCAPIVADLQSCTTNLCVCTSQVASDYQVCLNCLASLGSSATINSDVANAVSTFNAACASVSTSIALITAPPTGTNANASATALSGTAAPTLISSGTAASPPASTQTAPTAASTGSAGAATGSAGAASGSAAASATATPSKGYGDGARLSWHVVGALALGAVAYLW
ncbi:hypothetical protein JB92DRAFT_2908870 [Gautieria morchelliformis]|nr:hypothetical protein JB92DRAFT_2908870 [Gautieria morchelliformis]